MLPHLLILLLLLPPALCQTFTNPLPEQISNQTTYLSSTHPLTTAFTNLSPLLPPLLSHITFISRAAQTSATAARKNSSTPLTTTCNYRPGDQWTQQVSQYFLHRSWGEVDDNCVTDVYGAGIDEGVGIIDSSEMGASSRYVFEAVMSFARGVDSIAETAAMNARLTWQFPNRANTFLHSIRTQNCVHDYAGFVRRAGDWYVVGRVTNADMDSTLSAGSRMFMHEYMRSTSEGTIVNAEMQVLRRDENDEAEFPTGTTSITNTSGAVSGSEFVPILSPDNLAVREALREGEHSTQQASDATTPSNIAILALPLAMNVVPVALIADVNTVGMLVYTLLTDVLTTIPLLIKGIEVLAIGVDTNVAVVTRVTGANLEDGNKAGEVWVAECRANGDLTATGVVLTVVAVGFMVGGIVAEFLAKTWVKRRGKAATAAAGLVMAGVVGRGVDDKRGFAKNV